jgi:hypothetical protein
VLVETGPSPTRVGATGLRRFPPFASSRPGTQGSDPESRRFHMRARRLILCTRCCTQRPTAGSRLC